MNKIIYQKRQWMKALWISLPAITFVVLALDSANQSMEQRIYGATLLACINIVVIAIIGSLKISIDEKQLIWQFGFLGKPKWTIDFRDIESVEICESSWVEGWGIRFTKEGMLYNAAGKSAIRINKKDGKSIRLGTAEPEVLAALLQQKMQQVLR
jgi:hypothetical protein